ncbi:MAG TPA: hypothetical protein VIK22_01055 [Candidatus Anoxymicrobiaceae bacterium]
MKKQISGVVNNISTNPFQTFSRKRGSNSTLLTFDISFDLCDEDGQVSHVWFQRSFRLPPPLVDGDHIEVQGRKGHFLGLIGKKNLYAVRIIDKTREKEYTPWRNKDLKGSARGAANSSAAEQTSA